MSKAISFFSGFVLGSLVGATMAVFMAPQPGKEFQAMIQQRVNLVIQEGQRAASERRAELEAQFAQSKQFQKPPAAPVV